MYMFFKWTASNSTLVTNDLSKYTWKLEFAGVLYQLRFVQPSCLCGFSDLFLAIALAPFTCAAPPSNHHKSCNRNTHICSTVHCNQTSSSHYTPKTSLLSEVASLTLSSTHRGAHTPSHNRTMPRVSRSNPMADSSDDESPQKNHRSPPPPRSLLPMRPCMRMLVGAFTPPSVESATTSWRFHQGTGLICQLLRQRTAMCASPSRPRWLSQS